MSPVALAAAAVAAAGLGSMAVAARHQAKGRLEDARALGRSAGLVAAAGSAGLALTSGTVPVAVAALAASTVAVLGALSGKPRPAWWIAAALMALAAARACYTSGSP